MKNLNLARFPMLLTGLAIGLLSAFNFANAATLSWSGGGGANANWDNSANWGFVDIPASGDTLIFSAGQPNLLNTNNIAGLTLNQLRFVGPGGGYTIRGNAFTLTNGIFATNSVGANSIQTPITLGGTDQTVEVVATLTLAGQLSGSVGVTKTGAGTLNYNANSNPYSGTTTVNGGTLVLNCGAFDAAFGGPLIINGATVRLELSFEIPNDQPITINAGGLLDLNNLGENISGNLTLSDGGTVNVGTASLTIAAPSTITVTSGANIIGTGAGNINLGAGPCEMNVVSDTLAVNSIVQGDAAITKTGEGSLTFSRANTYTGVTTIDAGMLTASHNQALGATNGGTVVNGTAALLLNNAHVTNEVLTLNSTRVSGALQNNATADWIGPIILNTNVFIEASSVFGIDGVISGPGGFTKISGSTLTLRGGTANTYAGATTVNEGTLVLSKADFVIAVPGDLIVAAGTVRLAATYQINDASDVMVAAGATLDFSTFSDEIDALSGAGTVSFGTNGWITVGMDDSSSTFDGVFTGVGYAPGWTIGKKGTGTFTMNGNNTYSAGNVTIQGGGKMIINGLHARPPILLESGSILGGSGTVGNIGPYLGTMGSISPGTSPGMLTSSNVVFTVSGNFTVELTGPTPGPGYDQLNVRGTNVLGNALLGINLAFTAPVAVGQQFRIINNDGVDAIGGIFAGYPGGTTFSQNGFTVSISYVGGTGNDVVLTLTAIPGNVAGSTVAAGNGDGAIAPNECNYLSVAVTNHTGTAMTGVSATLSSTTAGVIVTDFIAPYPNIAGNGTGTNLLPFQISTTTNFACGTDINLLLSVTAASHGAFTVPITLTSGVPAVAAVRFDNNTATNVPDVGTIESTNNVAVWTGGPITKVGVSLWLSAPLDGDLNLTLIAPDGSMVDLSSGNGGAGANFGTGPADGSRTTFDDGAATSITAGTAPFVGTFRPEASLAALIGTSPVVGDWRLRIQDTGFFGAPDTLRNWSLFLYGTDCGVGSGLCELCPNVTLSSAFGPSALVQTNFVGISGTNSICGVAKPCPGTIPGIYPADSFTFRNGPSDACITVTVENIDVLGNMAVTAYLGSFDPANVCANYLANPADYVDDGSAETFSFNVASNATFVINLVGGSYGSYRLTVLGGDCRPTLNVTDVGAGQARLDWTTAASGYQLESTNTLVSASPIWPAITNSPVVVNSRFQVTNTVPSANQFYRLRKPLP